jgi:ubiquinone/menaquinone biosynthesis C-methylase UbiE
MGSTETERPDPPKRSDFAERLLGIINDSGLALLLSIGHRTGLFDVMADRAPSSAAQIAEMAGLREQHVREWLDGMVGGGIVLHDLGSGTYELPSEHAACLSEVAPPENLAALAGYLPLLGAAEDRIVARFQKQRHTPYDARPSFRQLVSKGANESDRMVMEILQESILPLVSGIQDALQSGITVLDVGCGNGRALSLAATMFPKSRFHGYDISLKRIDRAKWRAFKLGLSNIHFHVADVADLDQPGRYDLITAWDVFRQQKRTKELMLNLACMLRPGGVFLMQEGTAATQLDETIGLPKNSPLRTARILAEDDESGGPLWGKQKVKSLLIEAGFENVVMHQLPHNIYNCYFVSTKGSRPTGT